MPNRHARVIFSVFESYLDGVAKQIEDDDQDMWDNEEIKLKIVEIKYQLNELIKYIPELGG